MNTKTKLTLGLAMVATSGLQAQISFVGSSAALGGNDSLVWSQLGGPSTLIGSGTTTSSANGLAITVRSGNGGVMQVAEQGSDWNGNFYPNEFLLFNQDNGDISISYADGIYGGGAQVDADGYGSFTGTISAYGASNNLLGSFSFSGIGSGAGDGSAPFAGILSSTPDIYNITFSATGGIGIELAIGTLDLNTPSPVPEPTILALAGLSSLSLLLFRRQRK